MSGRGGCPQALWEDAWRAKEGDEQGGSASEDGGGFEEAARDAVERAAKVLEQRLESGLSSLQRTGDLRDEDVQDLVAQFTSRTQDLIETAVSLMSIVPDVVERLAAGQGGEGQQADEPDRSEAKPTDDEEGDKAEGAAEAESEGAAEDKSEDEAEQPEGEEEEQDEGDEPQPTSADQQGPYRPASGGRPRASGRSRSPRPATKRATRRTRTSARRSSMNRTTTTRTRTTRTRTTTTRTTTRASRGEAPTGPTGPVPGDTAALGPTLTSVAEPDR